MLYNCVFLDHVRRVKALTAKRFLFNNEVPASRGSEESDSGAVEVVEKSLH